MCRVSFLVNLSYSSTAASMVTRLLLLTVIFSSKSTLPSFLLLLLLLLLLLFLPLLFPVIELHLAHLTLSTFTCVFRLPPSLVIAFSAAPLDPSSGSRQLFHSLAWNTHSLSTLLPSLSLSLYFSYQLTLLSGMHTFFASLCFSFVFFFFFLPPVISNLLCLSHAAPPHWTLIDFVSPRVSTVYVFSYYFLCLFHPSAANASETFVLFFFFTFSSFSHFSLPWRIWPDAFLTFFLFMWPLCILSRGHLLAVPARLCSSLPLLSLSLSLTLFCLFFRNKHALVKQSMPSISPSFLLHIMNGTKISSNE